MALTNESLVIIDKIGVFETFHTNYYEEVVPTMYMKQHHTIEIFSANCPLCRHITDDIEIGKCQGCKQVVYDVNEMSEDVKAKMKDYGVKAVPTTVINGNIKVVGIPDFPWVCGNDLYKRLKDDYSFR